MSKPLAQPVNNNGNKERPLQPGERYSYTAIDPTKKELFLPFAELYPLWIFERQLRMEDFNKDGLQATWDIMMEDAERPPMTSWSALTQQPGTCSYARGMELLDSLATDPALNYSLRASPRLRPYPEAHQEADEVLPLLANMERSDEEDEVKTDNPPKLPPRPIRQLLPLTLSRAPSEPIEIVVEQLQSPSRAPEQKEFPDKDDALDFLKQVQAKHPQDTPEYAAFIDVLQLFKLALLDHNEAAVMVADIFKNDAELLSGFEKFKPPSMKNQDKEEDIEIEEEIASSEDIPIMDLGRPVPFSSNSSNPFEEEAGEIAPSSSSASPFQLEQNCYDLSHFYPLNQDPRAGVTAPASPSKQMLSSTNSSAVRSVSPSSSKSQEVVDAYAAGREGCEASWRRMKAAAEETAKDSARIASELHEACLLSMEMEMRLREAAEREKSTNALLLPLGGEMRSEPTLFPLSPTNNPSAAGVVETPAQDLLIFDQEISQAMPPVASDGTPISVRAQFRKEDKQAEALVVARKNPTSLLKDLLLQNDDIEIELEEDVAVPNIVVEPVVVPAYHLPTATRASPRTQASDPAKLFTMCALPPITLSPCAASTPKTYEEQSRSFDSLFGFERTPAQTPAASPRASPTAAAAMAAVSPTAPRRYTHELRDPLHSSYCAKPSSPPAPKSLPKFLATSLVESFKPIADSLFGHHNASSSHSATMLHPLAFEAPWCVTVDTRTQEPFSVILGGPSVHKDQRGGLEEPFMTIQLLHRPGPAQERFAVWSQEGAYIHRNDSNSYPEDLATVSSDDLASRMQKQVEYYFTDRAFERDVYLQDQFAKHGGAPVAIVAGFRRMRMLNGGSTDVAATIRAVRLSHRLRLSQDNRLIYRRTDVEMKSLPTVRAQPYYLRTFTSGVEAREYFQVLFESASGLTWGERLHRKKGAGPWRVKDATVVHYTGAGIASASPASVNHIVPVAPPIVAAPAPFLPLCSNAGGLRWTSPMPAPSPWPVAEVSYKKHCENLLGKKLMKVKKHPRSSSSSVLQAKPMPIGELPTQDGWPTLSPKFSAALSEHTASRRAQHVKSTAAGSSSASSSSVSAIADDKEMLAALEKHAPSALAPQVPGGLSIHPNLRAVQADLDHAQGNLEAVQKEVRELRSEIKKAQEREKEEKDVLQAKVELLQAELKKRDDHYRKHEEELAERDEKLRSKNAAIASLKEEAAKMTMRLLEKTMECRAKARSAAEADAAARLAQAELNKSNELLQLERVKLGKANQVISEMEANLEAILMTPGQLEADLEKAHERIQDLEFQLQVAMSVAGVSKEGDTAAESIGVSMPPSPAPQNEDASGEKQVLSEVAAAVRELTRLTSASSSLEGSVRVNVSPSVVTSTPSSSSVVPLNPITPRSARPVVVLCGADEEDGELIEAEDEEDSDSDSDEFIHIEDKQA